MDELEISGKRYISTRRAAKDHKYHSDYIGQLIRAGKVEGQKVGRSWYVAADSLAEYLGKEAGVKSSTPIKAVRVEPVAAAVRTAVTFEPEQAELEEVVAEEIIDEAPTPQITVGRGFDQSIGVEDREERHIPVKISRPAEIKKEVPAIRTTRGSLRYLEDDGPLYPRAEERPRAQVMPRFVEEVQEEIVMVEEENPVIIFEKPKRSAPKIKSFVLRGGVVVAIGVITLGVVAAASAFVVSTTTIQGETASVSYSVGSMR